MLSEAFSSSVPGRIPKASPSRQMWAQSLSVLAALTQSMYFSSVNL